MNANLKTFPWDSMMAGEYCDWARAFEAELREMRRGFYRNHNYAHRCALPKASLLKEILGDA